MEVDPSSQFWDSLATAIMLLGPPMLAALYIIWIARFKKHETETPIVAWGCLTMVLFPTVFLVIIAVLLIRSR